MLKSLLKSILFLTVFSVTVFAQTQTVLEIDKQLEREIKGGESHSYQISLETGKFAQVKIEQKSVDLTSRVFGLDGKVFDSYDADIRTIGLEKPVILAEIAGTYRLDVEVKSKTAPVGSYTIRIEEVRDLSENDKLFQESKLLLRKASELNTAGKFQEAIAPAEQSIAIREKILSANDVQIGLAKQVLATIYANLSNFQKSEALFLGILSNWEKNLLPDDYRIALILHNLGATYNSQGELEKAESYFLRALEIRKKSLGEYHSDTAATYNSLGIVYRRKDETAKSLKMYENALLIREKLFGADNPLIASVLVNIGSLFYYTGDYEKAESTFKRALEIREKSVGVEHPETALVLNNLGLAYIENKKYDEAETAFKRALAIREKVFGIKSTPYLSALGNLGDLYFKQNNFQKAEQIYLQAVQTFETLSQNDPIGFAVLLAKTGSVYGQLRDFTKAESYLLRALELYTAKYGNYNSNIGTTSNQLALMYAFKGDETKAVLFQNRASQINELVLGLNLGTGSERQKIALVKLFNQDLDQAITIHTKLASNNSDAAENAFTAILQRKGRVQDAMTNSLAILRQRLGEDDRKLLSELNEVNTKLAEIVVGNSSLKPAEKEKQIEMLRERKEKVESRISVASGGNYTASSAVSLKKIREVIPEKSVLIEFKRYESFDLKTGKRNEPSYVVYFAGKTGEIGWKELGEAKPIDTAIAKFRQALQDPKSTNFKQLSRDLDEKIFAPIRSALGDSTQLLISPDGELNLIPFEALIDKNGKYLVENYSISYLSSGRDLLRMQNSMPNNNTPLILANPAFGEFAVAQNIKTNNGKRNVNVVKSLSETYFAPLSGTEKEGQEIKKLFPKATLLTGEKANKTALKESKSPSILHIATHGFFIEPDEKAIENGNPLLRSGLALAGANNHSEKETDGIFTALEGAGLNLFGTKLVVLSACGTGLGDVQTGEGVFGLRRSFVLAGSESLVISLWSVSDYITRELMVNYYKNLKQGLGRGESLRKVQLEMLKNPKRQHPFYWASFIQSGNWKELENIK